MDNWKDIEDVSQDCSYENGWCGWCWRCCDHAQDLHDRDKWEDEE